MHPDEVGEQTSHALHRGNANLKCVPSACRYLRRLSLILAAGFLVMGCSAQDQVQGSPTQSAKPAGQLNVNWFYGSYVPKEVALMPLDGRQRFKLYLRQTYTTPGIYIKTALFAIHDQISDSNPEWGDDFEGFAKRLGNRQVQFIIQNSISSLGNGILTFGSPATTAVNAMAFGRALACDHQKFCDLQTEPRYLYGHRSCRISVPSVRPQSRPPGNPTIPNGRYEGTRQQSRRFLLGRAYNWIGEFAPKMEGFSRKRRSKYSRKSYGLCRGPQTKCRGPK